MALNSLSDSDLKRLYNDARAGVRQPTATYDTDGYHERGYTRHDYYTGDTGGYNYRGNAKSDEVQLSKLWQKSGVYKGQRVNTEEIARQGLYKVFDEYERRQAANKRPSAAPAPAAPAPEPKKPTQKIGPVKYSDEIQNAQNTVNDYQSPYKLHDTYNGGFQQNETDFTTQFNFGGDRMNAEQSDKQSADQQPTPQQNQAQQLADNYKLNLISSGATKGQSKQFEYNDGSK